MPNVFDQFDASASSSSDETSGKQGNVFDQFDPSGNVNVSSQQPQQNQPDNGAFMAGIDQFNRAFGRVAEGTIAALADVVGATKVKKNAIAVQKKLDAEANESFKQHPIAGSIGMGIGEAGKWVAYGGPSSITGGVLASSAKTAMQQGLLGYMSAPADATDDEKLNNGMNNAAMGAGAVGLIKGVPTLYGKAAPIVESIMSSPKTEMIKKGAGIVGFGLAALGGAKSLLN